MDKLQTKRLKFESVWILHPKISKFGFYPLKFYSVCINSPDPPSIFSIKCHINLTCVFSLSNKIMPHNFCSLIKLNN